MLPEPHAQRARRRDLQPGGSAPDLHRAIRHYTHHTGLAPGSTQLADDPAIGNKAVRMQPHRNGGLPTGSSGREIDVATVDVVAGARVQVERARRLHPRRAPRRRSHEGAIVAGADLVGCRGSSALIKIPVLHGRCLGGRKSDASRPESRQFFLQCFELRVQLGLFRPLPRCGHKHRRLLNTVRFRGAGLRFAGEVVEEGIELKELSLRNRIVFVVVALRTLHGEA